LGIAAVRELAAMQTIRITDVPVLFTCSTELRQPLLWQCFCWAHVRFMERKLLFRAWLPDYEKMLYSNNQLDDDFLEVWQVNDNSLNVEIQETVWKEGGGETYEQDIYITPKQTVMQITGLKDKNGKDIWEGDIVKNWQGGWNVVVWKDYAFQATVSKDQCSFYSLDWWSQTEVIGNMYENPELMVG
jgi:uncharacterized phage protein (TIGR01671 family)